jgi:hypothetical protein
MNKPPSDRSKTGSFARTVGVAFLIVGLIVGGLVLWSVLSSGGDATLPFAYEGFD